MKRTHWMVRAVVCAVVGLSLAGCGMFKKTAAVPEVTNRSLDLARLDVQTAGLVLSIAGEVESSEAPAGTVMKQEPVAGMVLKRGGEVRVWVAKAPTSKKVPDVAGLSIAEASGRLFEANMRVGSIGEVYSDSVEPDKVAATEPPAGTALKKGAPVDLLLSKGPEAQFVVPNLIGMGLSRAKKKIAEAGLNVGSVKHKVTEDYYEGVVVGQDPKPDTKVDKGAAVNLVVSAVLH